MIRALDVVGTLARFGLAAVWLFSGIPKALDPDQTYVAVRSYDVLPPLGVELVAAGVAWLEIALATLLLLGLGTRVVAVVLAVFVAGVTQAWVRGLSIDCGCFGGGGQVEPGQTAYVEELVRDTGFLLLAAWLVVRPRTLFALDPRIR